MPWTTQYFSNGAALRFEGTTTGDEIYRSKIEVLAHDFPDRPRFILCDFTPVETFAVTPNDIDRLVELFRRAEPQIRDFSIAVVAPQPIEYGLARMWEISVEGSGFRTSVVHTRPEALHWLTARGVNPLPPDDSAGKRTSGPSRQDEWRKEERRGEA
jgi:hypothetical protein